jgi:glucose/arabinose dehydrogenase
VAEAPAAQVRVELKRVLGGLDRPVAVVSANDGTGRLFVAERPGTVRVVERTGHLVRKPFINVTKQVGGVAAHQVAILGDGAREGRGLLGLAFHPDFKANGLVFVSYTDKLGDLRVSRFKAKAEGGVPAMAVDPSSERVLLKVGRRSANVGLGSPTGHSRTTAAPRSADHNGGQLAFGPDRFLYIGVGDSGGTGDPGDSAQDRRSLRGKVLRVGVDEDAAGAIVPAKGGVAVKPGQLYSIPSSNPFAKLPAFRSEIWALGVRDPRGLSFDRKVGSLWVADTGEGLRQEVNRIGAGLGGRNLGWDCREGTIDVSNRHGGAYCATRQFSGPIWNYRVARERCSIVGGRVYRGARFAKELGGRYLYADHCSGEVWALNERAGKTFGSTLVGSRRGITAFGEDDAGELVVTTSDGVLHRLVVAGSAAQPEPVPGKALAPTTTTVAATPVTGPAPTSSIPAPSSTVTASTVTASSIAAPAKVSGTGKSPVLPSNPNAALPVTEPAAGEPTG